MKAAIYCKPTAKGVHSFYLVKGNDEIFLFSQPYRKGVADYFGQGIILSDAFRHSKAHEDAAVLRTMNKIPMYVKYIEKEYGIEVLEQTKKKGIRRGRRQIAYR